MSNLKNLLAKQRAAVTQPVAAPAQASIPAEASKPKSALAGMMKKPVAAPAKPAPASAESTELVPTFSMADLAASTSTGTRAPDETPANIIPRNLPDEMTPGMKAFVSTLDILYENLADSEMLGQACVSVMIELKSNPQYEQLVSDEDVRMLIKAARDAMGLARIKKTEAKAKRGGAKKATTKAIDSDVAAIFGEMGITL